MFELFTLLDSHGNSIKVGWREDKQSGGHIIAVHFPMTIFSVHRNSKDFALLAGKKLQSSNISSTDNNLGGIDFNSDKMNLNVQNNGGEIKFHIDRAMSAFGEISPNQRFGGLQQLQNAPGFSPVIINVQPLKDLPGFLGIKNS